MVLVHLCQSHPFLSESAENWHLSLNPCIQFVQAASAKPPSECEDILGSSQSIEICTEPVAQTLSEPFDKLRANGGCIENMGNFPFVLSLSKHE